MKWTGKLAKQTVRESYPKACCRFCWYSIEGERNEYYEIMPDLRITTDSITRRWRGPEVLGRGPTQAKAWIAAAEKLVSFVT